MEGEEIAAVEAAVDSDPLQPVEIFGVEFDTKRMNEAAGGHATRLGSDRVGTEHLLMALADQPAPVRDLLIELGVDPDHVPTIIEEVLSRKGRNWLPKNLTEGSTAMSAASRNGHTWPQNLADSYRP